VLSFELGQVLGELWLEDIQEILIMNCKTLHSKVISLYATASSCGIINCGEVSIIPILSKKN